MAGVFEAARDPVNDIERFAVVDPLEEGDCVFNVLLRVQRNDGRKPLLPALFRDELSVFLLNIGAVFQHHLAKALRRRCAKDLPPESLLHESRQVAAMIDVGVGEDDGFDIRRVEGESAVTFLRFISSAVIHPAIKEDRLSCHRQQMHGTGNGARGPLELKMHGKE